MTDPAWQWECAFWFVCANMIILTILDAIHWRRVDVLMERQNELIRQLIEDQPKDAPHV